MFVLDGSVNDALGVRGRSVGGGARRILHRLQTERAFVPGVWPLEACNALLRLPVRRGRLEKQKSERFVAALEDLQITVDDAVCDVFLVVLPLASQHDLSSYDAAYLELALRKKAPLATLDAGLARAARAAGVEVLGGA